VFGSGSGGGSGGGSSGSPALLHRGSLGAASNPNPLMPKKSWPESISLFIFRNTKTAFSKNQVRKIRALIIILPEHLYW
jgi:hypothetical protein